MMTTTRRVDYARMAQLVDQIEGLGPTVAQDHKKISYITDLVQEAQADERDKIIKWLRHVYHWQEYGMQIADRIEKLEHY